MRTWQIVCVDDRPGTSLEALYLDPLVEIPNQKLNNYLPEAYALQAEESFQKVSPSERRGLCRLQQGRWPIVDCTRSFVEAWRLFEQYLDNPPDIIFLDVDLGETRESPGDLSQIQEHISAHVHRNGEALFSSSGKVAQFVARGGIYLFGKLLRLFPSKEKLPHIIIYSEHPYIHDECLPMEYAFEGVFSVRDKLKLNTDEQVLKQIVEGRLLQYLQGGAIKVSAVEESLRELEQYLNIVDKLGISDDVPDEAHCLLRSAMSRDIGQDWCFGTFFIYQTPIIADWTIDTLPETRCQCIKDIQSYLHRVDNCRALHHVFEKTPIRLYTHVAEEVEFPDNPPWLNSELHGQFVTLEDSVKSAQQLKEESIAQVGNLLPELLSQLERHGADLLPLVQNLPDTEVDLNDEICRYKLGNATSVLKSIEELRKSCRVMDVPMQVYNFLRTECGEQGVNLKRKNDESNEYKTFMVAKKQRVEDKARTHTFTYTLPTEGEFPISQPVSGLLRAIVSSVATKAYPHASAPSERLLWWAMRLERVNSRLVLELEDEGQGFQQDITTFNFLQHRGGLSKAIQQSMGWLTLEIHSRGNKRNPFVNDPQQVEHSEFQRGCKYALSIFVDISEA